MYILEEEIRVHAPPETVFRYVSNFTTIAQWDPAVQSCRKVTPGPIRPGTRFSLSARYAMVPVSMTYTVTSMDPPERIVLEGRGKSFTATDTITFFSFSGGTRIRYRAELDLSVSEESRAGVLIKRFLDRMGKAAVQGLEKAFNAPRPAPRITPLSRWLDRSVIGGLPGFTRLGYAMSRKRRQPVTSDLTGKTVVLTGATSGIGKAAAFGIARLGARLALVARNQEKAETVQNEIIADTGNDQVTVYTADLSLLSQVRQVADTLLEHEPSIDILINNAGALFNTRQETAEGFERTFAVDLLAPYALTEWLIPRIRTSQNGRIINVSSGGMYTQKIDPHDLQFEHAPYDGPTAYARAKRGLVLLTGMWQRRLSGSGISVHAMHPGWVATPGIEGALPGFTHALKPLLRNAEQGADTIVWLSHAPEAARSGGLFWLDRQPHPVHVFSHTRESVHERELFFGRMQQLFDRGTP